jgi:hypothetical protein
MKAIETQYNGYKFRSRLEARWAMFFDLMGIAYEYEMEGYQFDNGMQYLPDFWLPYHRQWIEIKGQEPTKEEKLKCELLTLATGYTSFIFTQCYFPIARIVYQDMGGAVVDFADFYDFDYYDWPMGSYRQGWHTWLYDGKNAYIGMLVEGDDKQMAWHPKLYSTYKTIRATRFDLF